jgi:hypothetical protein
MSVLRNEGEVSSLNGFLDFELINGSRHTLEHIRKESIYGLWYGGILEIWE